MNARQNLGRRYDDDQQLAALLAKHPDPRDVRQVRAQPDYAAMDEMGDYANNARRDRMIDDQIDEANEAVAAAAKAADIEDVRHELRKIWGDAIVHQHALTTPTLPTVTGPGKLLMVPINVMVGNLMDTCRAVDLVADALRTGNTDRLALHLRTEYVDAYADELYAIGWAA